MSMGYYSVEDYGLLLDDNTLKVIASKVCEDYTEEDFAEDPWEFIGELYTKGIMEYISDFTGEALPIRDDGSDDWSRGLRYQSDQLCYAWTLKNPTLFQVAYHNPDEMVHEFKARLQKYLPEDFDYRSRICHFVGTYYG